MPKSVRGVPKSLLDNGKCVIGVPRLSRIVQMCDRGAQEYTRGAQRVIGVPMDLLPMPKSVLGVFRV